MLLEIDNLAVSYGKMAALHGVSLKVAECSITSIIGANGAGKSTLLNAISGVVKYTGRIALDGKPLPRTPHEVVKMGIVQVPEGRRVFSALTVEENLTMGAYTIRNRELIHSRLNQAFELFPILAERRRQLAGTLSGGEQQMLAISRGLMSGPRVLLLDEPSLGLAPRLVKSLFELFTKINEQGVTIVLVEQNAKQALAIAGHAYVLEVGNIVSQGAGVHLLEDPVIRKAYLGASGE
ncbi:MAG TPA: ABC transporter ATP-binding protein [Chloroflexota bacterium]|nr:ABC transporter ATP-binding protein [Chloroflexota bacterium]